MTGDRGDGDDVGNGLRAVFTLVGFSLIGPFFTGIVVLAVYLFAPLFKLGSLLPANSPSAGEAAVAAFVWAALPAWLAGSALALVVWKRQTFDWIKAAAAGGLAFMVAAILMPPQQTLSLTVLTFVAVGIALCVRSALRAGRIIL